MTRDRRHWIIGNLEDALQYIKPLREVNFIECAEITKDIETIERLLQATLAAVVVYPVEKQKAVK